MIDETLFDAEEKMEKAVTVAKDDLASVRTGRATPNMFSRVVVEYYGAMTPLNQLSSINIPEARMAIIKPYDTSQLRSIEKAIRDSDLGVNPSNDGQIIRGVIPQLSEGSAPARGQGPPATRARTPASRSATSAGRRWRSSIASSGTVSRGRTRS